MAQYPASATSTKLLVTKANTASQVDLQGSNNATTLTSVAGDWSSWGQVAATTSVEYLITSLVVRLQNAAATGVDQPLLLQLGVGGAGAETTLTEVALPFTVGDGIGSIVTVNLPIPQRITSGSRVAVRILNQATASNPYKVYVYGVPYASTEGN